MISRTHHCRRAIHTAINYPISLACQSALGRAQGCWVDIECGSQMISRGEHFPLPFQRRSLSQLCLSFSLSLVFSSCLILHFNFIFVACLFSLLHHLDNMLRAALSLSLPVLLCFSRVCYVRVGKFLCRQKKNTRQMCDCVLCNNIEGGCAGMWAKREKRLLRKRAKSVAT